MKSGPMDMKMFVELLGILQDRIRVLVSNTFLKDRDAIVAVLFLHVMSVLIPYMPKVKIRLNT